MKIKFHADNDLDEDILYCCILEGEAAALLPGSERH